MRIFLFTSKLIRFCILHSDWVRLNLFISCFVMVCLPGKVIVIASQMFLLQSQLIHVECFKNSLPFSSIPFTIPGAQLKVAGN